LSNNETVSALIEMAHFKISSIWSLFFYCTKRKPKITYSVISAKDNYFY